MEIRGLERLSFRERQVVVLKESGKPNAEVAKQLGLSPSSVATLYHRARTKGYQVVVILPGETLGIEEPEIDEAEAEK